MTSLGLLCLEAGGATGSSLTAWRLDDCANNQPHRRAPSFSFVSAEDILDDVSELAVNSPDEGPDDGPHLLLPSPGCHPEDLKSSVGSGQRVGHRMQILRNSSVRMQMWNKGCTCSWRDRITGLAMRTNSPARIRMVVVLKAGCIAAAV